MPQGSDKPTTTRPKAQTALWRAMADTTWRMLVPSVILVAGGIYLDLSIGTKPWLTLAGVVLGLTVSTFLIKQQLETPS